MDSDKEDGNETNKKNDSEVKKTEGNLNLISLIFLK